MNAGNFPVPGGAVFSRRCRVHQTPCAHGGISQVNLVERCDVAESARHQGGEIEASDGGSEVPERVASFVTVRRGIRCRTGADAVENDYRRASQLILRSSIEGVGCAAR